LEAVWVEEDRKKRKTRYLLLLLIPGKRKKNPIPVRGVKERNETISVESGMITVLEKDPGQENVDTCRVEIRKEELLCQIVIDLGIGETDRQMIGMDHLEEQIVIQREVTIVGVNRDREIDVK
jgi:hypothetical protein